MNSDPQHVEMDVCKITATGHIVYKIEHSTNHVQHIIQLYINLNFMTTLS